MKHKTSELTGALLHAAVEMAGDYALGFKDDFSDGSKSGPAWISRDGTRRSILHSDVETVRAYVASKLGDEIEL